MAVDVVVIACSWRCKCRGRCGGCIPTTRQRAAGLLGGCSIAQGPLQEPHTHEKRPMTQWPSYRNLLHGTVLHVSFPAELCSIRQTRINLHIIAISILTYQLQSTAKMSTTVTKRPQTGPPARKPGAPTTSKAPATTSRAPPTTSKALTTTNTNRAVQKTTPKTTPSAYKPPAYKPSTAAHKPTTSSAVSKPSAAQSVSSAPAAAGNWLNRTVQTAIAGVGAQVGNLVIGVGNSVIGTGKGVGQRQAP